MGIAAFSVLVLAAVSCPALAVDATWNGTTDALWATLGNWAGPPASVPGTGNTATFNNAGNGNTTISLAGGTIKYTANSTADSWMKTLTNAYVFPGGVTIDTQNRTGTISQILEKATGIGVTGVTLSYAGDGPAARDARPAGHRRAGGHPQEKEKVRTRAGSTKPACRQP